jgi:hypothetical protein
LDTAFAGVTVAGRVGVDAFLDSNSVLRVYAFIVGSTGKVYANFYDGAWEWRDQGFLNAQGTTPSVGAGVTHFKSSNGNLNVYAAAIGTDNTVYLNYGVLVPAAWSALPTYAGLTPYTDVGATAFVVAKDGSQALYVMTVASVVWSTVERDLHLDFWKSTNPSQWLALDQGSL